MSSVPAPQPQPFAALRRFARPAPPAERCELCGAGVNPAHPHLVEPAARRLVCCCDACALLVGSQQGGRYRRVSPRLEPLPGFRLSPGRWASLAVPVGIAFFGVSTRAGGAIAVYPNPAGVIEEPVPTEAWDALVADNPVLRDFEPDVEALLVNRVRGANTYYRASLDRCYELVGLVRKYWHGFSGGSQVWEEVERFFRSQP